MLFFVYVCDGMSIGVRKQLVVVSSLLLPCRFQVVRLNGKHLYPLAISLSPYKQTNKQTNLSPILISANQHCQQLLALEKTSI